MNRVSAILSLIAICCMAACGSADEPNPGNQNAAEDADCIGSVTLCLAGNLEVYSCDRCSTNSAVACTDDDHHTDCGNGTCVLPGGSCMVVDAGSEQTVTGDADAAVEAAAEDAAVEAAPDATDEDGSQALPEAAKEASGDVSVE